MNDWKHATGQSRWKSDELLIDHLSGLKLSSDFHLACLTHWPLNDVTTLWPTPTRTRDARRYDITSWCRLAGENMIRGSISNKWSSKREIKYCIVGPKYLNSNRVDKRWLVATVFYSKQQHTLLQTSFCFNFCLIIFKKCFAANEQKEQTCI